MTTPEIAPHAALLPTILAMVGEGATAEELSAQLAAEAGSITPDGMGDLLAHLASLGLVRAARADHEDPRYVVTSLGQQILSTSLAQPSDTTDRLAELETLRTDLLATISHELRTPLTALRTCAGLLLDPGMDALPDQRRQLAETIARNADRMQRLIEDVLDLTRFRAGRVQLQLRRFDAGALARDLVGSVAALATQHGQRIVHEAPDEPVWVYGDHRRLEQAVLNLLSNALKFSPDGAAVRFRVARLESEEVAWSVADVGPGISMEDQARLFERFFVGRNDRGEPFAGTGLGLPTALAIAQAHGGRVEFDSELGRGSVFTLIVPVGGPAEPDDA